ncbi:MAG: serine/threonine protein kinase [Anaerolineales bacterium]|nr:serine/threonine protein kinase [Anaerolineales bacterium]
MDTPKQKFKRYEITEELGIGGMATVYRAYDPLFEREVALKVLKRELLEDPELKERFERETKIVAKLEHAAIVPVYDVGFDNGQLFYVMRYMTGGSLSERINAGSLDLEQVAYILLRLADALDYAHRKGIIHRDLKPANILFDEVGNAFISDFGIAKFAQAATRITHSGIIGTPRYMSPEQARGEEIDGRSDLYTLGVLLFEILGGKAPFEATTPLALAFKHATEPAPDILKINPDLPPELGPILKKAMEKEPRDRYETCAEFANAFLEALPSGAAPNAKLITPLPPRPPAQARGAHSSPLGPRTSPKVQKERLDDRGTRRAHPHHIWIVENVRTQFPDKRFNLYTGTCHSHEYPSLPDAFSHRLRNDHSH